MSATSLKRSEDFLEISEQFKLGALTTESSHPVTANLSETARRDIAAALDLLFDVDADVLRKYREFVQSGRAHAIAETALRDGVGAAGLNELAVFAQDVGIHVEQQVQSRGDVTPGGFAEISGDRVGRFGRQRAQFELLADLEKVLRTF